MVCAQPLIARAKLYLIGSHLLSTMQNVSELFAGSGSLGFEALSRGANHVVMIDTDIKVAQQLKETAKILNAENLTIHQMTAEQYIQTSKEKFDIVFIDPPFSSNLIEPICNLLDKHDLLNPNAHIYIETQKNYRRPRCLHLGKF